MNSQLIFSLISAAVTIGGICITFGVIKGRVDRVTEENKVQATKEELSSAIKRSDEMLKLMQERAAEDRASGEGRYRELYGLLSEHSGRIKALETMQGTFVKSVEELKSDVKTGLREIRDDIKILSERVNGVTR